MKRLILLILLVTAAWARGQTFLPLNSSYPEIYTSDYYNPAPIVLIGNIRASAGMQFLYAGLAEDVLRNHYLSTMMPIGKKSAIGLRAQLFSADIFQKIECSLLASRALIDDRLAIGVNVNFLNHGFNRDKFILFDPYDPVIAEGTSASAFSGGVGLYLQPLRNLHIGAAADHLNEPDVSLDKSGILQRRVFSGGISWSGTALVPQVEARLEGEQIIKQAGAHLNLLDRHVRLFVAYNQYAGKSSAQTEMKGSNLLAEAELRIKNLGLIYDFQYPLTTDVSSIASGSHQLGVSFRGAQKPPSMPEVSLQNLSPRLQIPQAWLTGKMANTDGLRAIEIRINNDLWQTIPPDSLSKAKTYNLSRIVPLQVGSNIIQVTAVGAGLSASDKVFTLFEPEKPLIEVVSRKNAQIRDYYYELHFLAKDSDQLKRVRIYHDNELLEDITEFPDEKAAEIIRPTELFEGSNQFKILVDNPWVTTRDSLWVKYIPGEAEPELTIASKDLPISSSSQIVLTVNLQNTQNIKEVLLKVNGQQVDPTKVIQTRSLEVNDAAESNTQVVLDIASQGKSMIEAIALDSLGMPRISKSFYAYHNPHAKEMRYSRKHAFVVGIRYYKDKKAGELPSAVDDARAFAAVLDTLYHFDQIDTFYNENATYKALDKVFAQGLGSTEPGELVVIYFSGHGDKKGQTAANSQGFLMPWDAPADSATGRISIDYIKGHLRSTSAADVLCIFDACFSGAIIDSRPDVTFEQLPRKVDYDSLYTETKKQAVNLLMASTRNEEAVDGLFTPRLLQGLVGPADCNDDGYITSAELALYVQQYVGDEAWNRFQRKQNPQYGSIAGKPGECVFERTR